MVLLGWMVSRFVGRVVGLDSTGPSDAYKVPSRCIAAGGPKVGELTVAVAYTVPVPLGTEILAEIGAAMHIVVAAMVAAMIDPPIAIDRRHIGASQRTDGVAAVAGSVPSRTGRGGAADAVVGVAAAVGAD